MRSRSKATGSLILPVLAAAAFSTFLIPACDRDDRSYWSAMPAADGPPLSLRETYDRLRDWHAKRSYLAMRPFIDAGSRDELIDLLIAFDELLLANSGAQLAIVKACPTIRAEAFDMSPMADWLELFSQRLEFVSLQEEGDRGTIAVQIAGRLPEELEFERQDGRWVYLPGPIGPDLIPLVRDIARALNRITLAVSTGPHTAEEIEAEYRLRVGRRLERVNEPAAAEAADEKGADARNGG